MRGHRLEVVARRRSRPPGQPTAASASRHASTQPCRVSRRRARGHRAHGRQAPREARRLRAPRRRIDESAPRRRRCSSQARSTAARAWRPTPSVPGRCADRSSAAARPAGSEVHASAIEVERGGHERHGVDRCAERHVPGLRALVAVVRNAEHVDGAQAHARRAAARGRGRRCRCALRVAARLHASPTQARRAARHPPTRTARPTRPRTVVAERGRSRRRSAPARARASARRRCCGVNSRKPTNATTRPRHAPSRARRRRRDSGAVARSVGTMGASAARYRSAQRANAAGSSSPPLHARQLSPPAAVGVDVLPRFGRRGGERGGIDQRATRPRSTTVRHSHALPWGDRRTSGGKRPGRRRLVLPSRRSTRAREGHVRPRQARRPATRWSRSARRAGDARAAVGRDDGRAGGERAGERVVHRERGWVARRCARGYRNTCGRLYQHAGSRHEPTTRRAAAVVRETRTDDRAARNGMCVASATHHPVTGARHPPCARHYRGRAG